MTPLAREVREHVLVASHKSGHGHIPTSFSIIEMALASYAVLQHDPARPQWAERDLFLLSKGHAALGHYATLATLGYFSPEELATFGAFGSRLGCHQDRGKVPGVEVSTGSLGHAIGVGVGMALAFRLRGSTRRVFVIIGDGEANEGSVWEAMMVASDQRLGNLTVLYDDNRSQERCLQIPNPAERFRSFGLQVQEVDGHDQAALEQALRAPGSPDQPRMVVCRTVKGFGCPTLVNDVYAWHRRAPNAQELEQLRSELHQQVPA